jgi:hypothetical protein
VVNHDGAFLGSLQTPRLNELAVARPDAPVGRLAGVEAMTVPVEAAPAAAVDAVSTSRGDWCRSLTSTCASSASWPPRTSSAGGGWRCEVPSIGSVGPLATPSVSARIPGA